MRAWITGKEGFFFWAILLTAGWAGAEAAARVTHPLLTEQAGTLALESPESWAWPGRGAARTRAETDDVCIEFFFVCPSLCVPENLASVSGWPLAVRNCWS